MSLSSGDAVVHLGELPHLPIWESPSIEVHLRELEYNY